MQLLRDLVALLRIKNEWLQTQHNVVDLSGDTSAEADAATTPVQSTIKTTE